PGQPARTQATGGNRGREPLRQATRRSPVTKTPVRLGLRENAGQFSLLALINAFVGLMVGLERAVLPLVGRQDFNLSSDAAVLSFILAFGFSKAFTNLGARSLAPPI